MDFIRVKILLFMDEKMQNKNAIYAKIAIARKQLNLNEETYRELLINRYNKNSATLLTITQLTDLLHYFSELGVVFISKKNKKRTNSTVSPHSRPDWINITPSMPFYSQKRQILAIWKKLGYSMSSLDTRVQREFNCFSFIWLQDEKHIIALLTDLQKREFYFDQKQKNK